MKIKFDDIKTTTASTHEWFTKVYNEGCEVLSFASMLHKDFCLLREEWEDLHDECEPYDEYYSHMFPKYKP